MQRDIYFPSSTVKGCSISIFQNTETVSGVRCPVCKAFAKCLQMKMIVTGKKELHRNSQTIPRTV